MDVIFFKNGPEFRKWLEKHHQKEKELFVGFYKVKSGKDGIKWSDAVDQALCFGWIDGVMRPIDENSYALRFTPRRDNSIWSAINIKKVQVLSDKGLMRPSGIAAFAKRTEARSAVYNFENEAKTLEPAYEKRFKANKKAWDFFSKQPPGYKKLNIFRVMSAKQEKTRLARLEKLINASADEKRL